MDRFSETETLVIAFSTTSRSLFLLAETRLRGAAISLYRHEDIVTFHDRRTGVSKASLYQLFIRAYDAEEAETLLADLPRVVPGIEADDSQMEPDPLVSPSGKRQAGRQWLLAFCALALLSLLAWLLVAASRVEFPL